MGELALIDGVVDQRQRVDVARAAARLEAQPMFLSFSIDNITHNNPSSSSRFGMSMDTENGQMSIVNTGEHPDPHMNIATPVWTFRPVVDIGGPR